MKYLLYIFFLFSLAGCSEWDIFSGEEIVKTYDNLEYFEQIHVDGLFNVELIQSENPKVVFRGTEEQHESLTISVKEKKLNIESKKTNQLNSGYSKAKLEIHQDSINQFWIYGPVNLYSNDTIKTDIFKLYYICELADTDLKVETSFFGVISQENSAGEYNFQGKSKTFSIRLRGSSFINAENLQARKVKIEQISIGDIHVNSQEKLKIISLNSGDVYYTGNPKEVEIELNSSGQVFN
ncbi:MAG: GIN domain-containing protein, partial [Bacteroidota bacterium]